MSRIRTSLSFRVRYEGRVQTFDRRPIKESQADLAKGRVYYLVAHTLSKFRKELARPKKKKNPAYGAGGAK